MRLPKTWDKKYLKDVRVRFVANWQGIPSRDLIGRSDGLRQPGYTVSVGPSVTWAQGKNFWIADVPFTIAGHVDAGRSAIPGLPEVRGGVVFPSVFNPSRNLGMIAPLAISLRYVRAI
jgi:hypothetical protein